MKRKVTLGCEVCKSKNYRLNKTGVERLELKKFCKHCVSSTLHKEEK